MSSKKGYSVLVLLIFSGQQVLSQSQALHSPMRCPDFAPLLPRRCLTSSKQCNGNQACMTFPDGSQRCMTFKSIGKFIQANPQIFDCSSLSCTDPLPWLPKNCPSQNCTDGSQCAWFAGNEACVPMPMLWNSFSDGSNSTGPKCDYFCHEAVPGVQSMCDFKCYRGYTCRLRPLGHVKQEMVPHCVSNPWLWSRAELVTKGTLPKPVCLDMVLSYGRNKFDQVDELLKADRMLYDIFIRIIFMPLCIGIGILGLCLLSCLAKSLISMLWVSRHSICLGCVSLSKKLKRHFVEKQLYEIHA